MFTRSEKHDQSALRNAKPDDPVLAMSGLGKHLWKDECGDEFIKRERTGWRAQVNRQAADTKVLMLKTNACRTICFGE